MPHTSKARVSNSTSCLFDRCASVEAVPLWLTGKLAARKFYGCHVCVCIWHPHQKQNYVFGASATSHPRLCLTQAGQALLAICFKCLFELNFNQVFICDIFQLKWSVGGWVGKPYSVRQICSPTQQFVVSHPKFGGW